MKQTKTPPTSRVVPFTGHFYPEPEPAPKTDAFPAYLTIVAAALVAGLAIGAISTYQSADQAQLRQMKAQSEQLEKVKTQVCK